MNFSANVLLATGASPIMAHSVEELEDLSHISGSAVANIGTLDEHWIKSFYAIQEISSKLNKPFVLDPVGCGASKLRTSVAQKILDQRPSIVRGNASEISSILGLQHKTKGVDSTTHSTDVISQVREHLIPGITFLITGETDYALTTEDVFSVHGGHPLMTKVTAIGCALSSVVAAFCSVNQNFVQAASHAAVLFAIAGKVSAEKVKGPGSFAEVFLDEIYGLDEEKIDLHFSLEKLH